MLFVVGEAVGVEAFADRGISGFTLFVLVEDPFGSAFRLQSLHRFFSDNDLT